MTPVGSSRGSLRVRMLVSATLVLIVFLGVMGLVLDNAYRLSAEQAVSERLLLHIYALIAASDEDRTADVTSLYLPDNLQEPHFNSMGTGLFGIVFDVNGKEIWRSRSALDLALGPNEKRLLLAGKEPGVVSFARLPAANDHEPIFFLTYPVIWQSSAGDARYVYAVLQGLEPFRNEIAAFRNSLWGWLSAGILVLVTLQAAIMYWGLLPISRLEQDLQAIEKGEQEYLQGRYPREIDGVTNSLNLLLARERKQRERYRTTLADLAHSLKTPLAILRGEAARPDPSVDAIRQTLDEQVGRMNELVSYQLERAVAGSGGLALTGVAVAPTVEKLSKAIRQVYLDKGIFIEKKIEPANFRGDERDLLELLGNLLDNACKYGSRLVRLSVTLANNKLVMIVEDDGPGIDSADRRRVLERGTRLDTRVEGQGVAGQGIGLAVVAGIADHYGGEVTIDTSDLGGARVTIELPGTG